MYCQPWLRYRKLLWRASFHPWRNGHYPRRAIPQTLAAGYEAHRQKAHDSRHKNTHADNNLDEGKTEFRISGFGFRVFEYHGVVPNQFHNTSSATTSRSLPGQDAKPDEHHVTIDSTRKEILSLGGGGVEIRILLRKGVSIPEEY